MRMKHLSQESSVWFSDISSTSAKGLLLMHTFVHGHGTYVQFTPFLTQVITCSEYNNRSWGIFFFPVNNESSMTMTWSSSHPEHSSLSVARSLSKWCRIWVRKVALEVFTPCTGYPCCALTPALLSHHLRKPLFTQWWRSHRESIMMDSSLLEQRELMTANDRKCHGTFLRDRGLIIQHWSTWVYVFPSLLSAAQTAVPSPETLLWTSHKLPLRYWISEYDCRK